VHTVSQKFVLAMIFAVDQPQLHLKLLNIDFAKFFFLMTKCI
jgi:hypothetical protein